MSNHISSSTKPNCLLQVKDKWYRILAILLPFLLVAYSNGILLGVTPVRVGRILVSLAAIVLICEGTRFLVYRSYRWFPEKYRLLIVILIGVAATTVILSSSSLLRRYISTGTWGSAERMNTMVSVNGKQLTINIWGYGFLNALTNFGALLLMFQILYRHAQYRHAESEKERLEKEKVRAELLQLKGIVNPHFLFNNLNSLSSLISENPDQAQKFLDELTQVFRYLLRNNQTELTTLAEELKFIQTYYHLLRTRYGQAINMEIKTDESYNDLRIPPLTLQLLVENAVKHNSLQKDNPLYIELIPASGKRLMIRNTISLKEGRVESTGIGLQTINARYRMLNRQGVVIEKNDKSFTAIISLIDA